MALSTVPLMLAAEAGEAASGGMPQLDVSTHPPQLIWLAITFVTFYLLMSRVVLPRIGGVLTARAERITSDLARAEGLKKQAQEMQAAYDAAIAKARAEAQDLVREATQSVTKEADARRGELEHRLGEEARQAEARIAAAKDAAMVELRSVAADVAQSMASKLAGISVGADAARRAVDAELGQV